MPPIQTLNPGVKREYLNKYYLPKLQEDLQPSEVLNRVTVAALGPLGKTGRDSISTRKPPPLAPTPSSRQQQWPPCPLADSGARRQRDSSSYMPSLNRSASEPLPLPSTQRKPGSLAVPSQSGKYGSLWLPPHPTSSQYGGEREVTQRPHAGPQRLWGPVAQMTLAEGRSKMSSSSSHHGSGRIRFSESCGRTPSESCGRTPEPSCR